MTAGPLPLESLLAALTPLIHEAGALVMRVYATDFQVEIKGDESPVTLADQCAEKVIFEGLRRIAPDIPVVGEEAASAGNIPDVSNRFWLVDPIDGTKEFISRNGEFTVNIALVEHGVPVLGLVLAPAIGRLFSGATGLGAWVEDGQGRRAIAVRPVPPEGLTVVGSRHHGDDSAVTALLAGPPRRAPTRPSARRSSCAWWPKAPPTSIRVSDARWSGTPPPATPCCGPRAAPCARWPATCWPTPSRGSRTRTSWPGARAERRQAPHCGASCGLATCAERRCAAASEGERRPGAASSRAPIARVPVTLLSVRR